MGKYYDNFDFIIAQFYDFKLYQQFEDESIEDFFEWYGTVPVITWIINESNKFYERNLKILNDECLVIYSNGSINDEQFI